jgi:type IV pilus assembly protein PilK
MKNDEFLLWQTMLERKTGLWLPETRKAFLVTSLTRHMREKNIKQYKEFYHLLDNGLVSALDWANLVDSLTVHETCFYRDKEAIELVTKYCRNSVLNRSNYESKKGDNIQLWSVGCSTGEETYTLALEMEKLRTNLKDTSKESFLYGVTGVDVSYPSLAIAREGIYKEKQMDFVPDTTVNNFFSPVSDGHVAIDDRIKKRTCFVQANISELDESFNQKFDVIYCQNVLIYFKKENKNLVINELSKRLAPGGLLVLGHGEITTHQCDDLIRVNDKNCLAFVKDNSAENAGSNVKKLTKDIRSLHDRQL